jgi:hypothetical protein
MRIKTSALLSIVLAAGATLSVSANAESYNERGELFIATAPQGSSAKPFTGAAVSFAGFNERGIDFIETAPAGSAGPRGPQIVRAPSGFNERGHSIFDVGGSDVDGNPYLVKIDLF